MHHSVSLPLKCKNIQKLLRINRIKGVAKVNASLRCGEVRTGTCNEDGRWGRLSRANRMIWPDQLGSSDQYVPSSILGNLKNRFFESSHFRISKMCNGLKFKIWEKDKEPNPPVGSRVFAVTAVNRSPRLSINVLFSSQYSRDKTSI